MPVPLSKPKLLIGEGQDEVNFFTALVRHLGLTDIQIEKYDGKTMLARYLKEFRVRPDNQTIVSIGITRDADLSVSSVLSSISAALTANGFSVPAAPGQFAAGTPTIGVFIMPDNSNQGMLEDLCLQAVQSDPAIHCIDEFFKCVETAAARIPNNIAKARVHAWLASQLEPDLRLGEAALRDLWPWSAAAFAPFQQFVRAL